MQDAFSAARDNPKRVNSSSAPPTSPELDSLHTKQSPFLRMIDVQSPLLRGPPTLKLRQVVVHRSLDVGGGFRGLSKSGSDPLGSTDCMWGQTPSKVVIPAYPFAVIHAKAGIHGKGGGEFSDATVIRNGSKRDYERSVF